MYSVDQKLSETPNTVIDRDLKLKAALSGDTPPVKPAKRRLTGGSAGEMDTETKPTPTTPVEASPAAVAVEPYVEPHESPAEPENLRNTIRRYIDGMESYLVKIESEALDFELEAVSVTVNEFSVCMLLSESNTVIKPKFGHNYSIQAEGKKISVVYAGGYLKDPKLPFTVLSFIINKDE